MTVTYVKTHAQGSLSGVQKHDFTDQKSIISGRDDTFAVVAKKVK